MPERLDIIVALRNEARRGFQQIRGDLRSLSRDAQRASQGIGDFAPGLRGATRQADRLGGEFQDVLRLADRIDDAINRQTQALQRQVSAAQASARAQRQAAQAQQSGLLSGIDNLSGNLAGGISGLAGAAGAAGIAALTSEIATQAGELSALDAQYRRSGVALVQFAGSQEEAAKAVEAVRRGAGGAIGELEAQQQATQLLALGLAKNTTELERFVNVARLIPTISASVKTLDQAIGEISLAAANQSLIRLDQLGLGVEETKRRFEELKNSGRGLTDQAAFLEAILSGLEAKLGDVTTSAAVQATGVEKLGVAWGDLRLAVSQDLSPGINSFADSLANATVNMTALVEQAGLVRTLLGPFTALTDAVGLTDGALIRAAHAAAEVAQEASSADRAMLAMAGVADGLTVTMSGAGDGMIGFAQNVLQAVAALNELAATNRAISGSIDSGREAIFRRAAGVASIVGEERALQLANLQADAYEHQAEATRDIAGNTDQVAFELELARKNAFGVFDGITKADAASKRLAKRGLKAMSKEARKAQQEFERLSGKVAGVLTGALDVGVGVDFDKILGREDAVNEPARRLADLAVKGFDSPWVQYFKDKFPGLLGGALDGGGDIKKAAASALKDFEDGLRPELLDKERAKERVRRMLVGEANIKSLADEISRELAGELGKSTSEVRAATDQALGIVGSQPHSVPIVPDLSGFQAQLQTALVPPDLSALQAQLNQTFKLALTGGDSGEEGQEAAGALRGGIMNSLGGIGIAVAEFIQKEITSKKSFDIVFASGEASGQRLVEGFESGIIELPNKFLDKIADLVTSRVDERLTNRQSLVGAN